MNKQKAFIRYKLTGLESDSHQYRRKQRLVQKITQHGKREYEKNRAKNNSKPLFQHVRGKDRVTRSVDPLRNSTGELLEDEGESMEFLNILFCFYIYTGTVQEDFQYQRVYISGANKGF